MLLPNRMRKLLPKLRLRFSLKRNDSKGRFYNLVDLVNQLEQEKAAGRNGRLVEKLLRYDLESPNHR